MESGIIKIDVDQIKEEDLQRAWKEVEHLQWKGPESSPLPWLDVRPVRDESSTFADERKASKKCVMRIKGGVSCASKGVCDTYERFLTTLYKAIFFNRRYDRTR